MTDEQLLDAITDRMARADKELAVEMANELEIMSTCYDDITELLAQRQVGWRRRFTAGKTEVSR